MIWRMRIVCWIPKATDTHSAYVILIAFPLQQWLHERVSVLRYTCIVCLANFSTCRLLGFPWFIGCSLGSLSLVRWPVITLWNQIIHYSVHISPPPRKSSPRSAFQTFLTFILSFHFLVSLPCLLFPKVPRRKFLLTFLTSPLCPHALPITKICLLLPNQN